jgi:thiosulfate sulfurtransferase
MPVAITAQELVLAQSAEASLQILDVRREPAFSGSNNMIPDAAWRNPDDIAIWSANLDRDRHVVLYCVHGHEVSQDCSSYLQMLGLHARYLDGGIARWIAEGHPTISK